MTVPPATLPDPAPRPTARTLLRDVSRPPRRGTVARARLVRRLVTARDVRVVVVSAPAGYGKTTLLEAWAAVDQRVFLWAPGRAWPAPVVLVVDDADHVEPELLAELVREAPPGATVAVASRAAPPLALGRLRADRRLLELGPRDLAMTRGEAGALLAASGVTLGAPALDALMRRTEGWPAALSLAALALEGDPDPERVAAGFGGDDRFVADYLRDEVLAGRSAAMRRLLRRSSILDELTGELCDVVVGTEGSGATLRAIGRSELPVAAVDRAETHFRCHPLLRDLLLAELRDGAPRAAAEGHARASAWFATHDDVPTAVAHAIAGGDLEHAGELVWSVALPFAWDGRHDALALWLARVSDASAEQRPALALATATSYLARGNRAQVDRWTAAAEQGLDHDDPPLAAGLAALRAAVASSPAAMRAGAAAAAAQAGPGSPWLALAALLDGVGALLAGAGDDARTALEASVRRAGVVVPGLAALAEAELAFAALVEDDDDEGSRLAERARTRAAAVAREGLPPLALVWAVAAFARARRGRVDEARADVAIARRLLPRADGLAPWWDAQTRLALARAELRLAGVVAARELLAEAARHAARVPGAPALSAWIDDAAARADAFAGAGPGSLTTAELRVLRLLPSHLSFREIGARLHVSGNTVKTQAHAVYRKLGASSRSAAVDRALTVGLLDG